MSTLVEYCFTRGTNKKGLVLSLVWSSSISRVMKTYECLICGLIYDEEEGWPDDDIEPGTKWEDVPEDWVCPDCGVGKEDFEMIEIE
jgi:rubredoxin